MDSKDNRTTIHWDAFNRIGDAISEWLTILCWVVVSIPLIIAAKIISGIIIQFIKLAW